MSASLTYDSVERYVRTTLGEPVVDVELTTEQIHLATEEALEAYGVAKPLFKLGVINGLPTVQKYSLTAAQYGRGIVQLMQPDMLRQPVSLDQFDVFKYHTFLPNLDPGDFYMERVWWSEVRRSAGSDEDWWVDDHGDGTADIYINPIPSEGKRFSYIYLEMPTLTTVPLVDDKLVKDYSLALCKQMLGRIRGKYSSVSGSEAAIELDGQSLREEGKEEQKAIDEYYTKLGDRIGPIRG